MFSKCKELVVTMLLLSLPLCFALAFSEDEGDVFFYVLLNDFCW